jgi:hypothetical protein
MHQSVQDIDATGMEVDLTGICTSRSYQSHKPYMSISGMCDPQACIQNILFGPEAHLKKCTFSRYQTHAFLYILLPSIEAPNSSTSDMPVRAESLPPSVIVLFDCV